MTLTAQSCIGLLVITGLAWILGGNWRRANWRAAIVGLALQLAIAALVVWLPPVRAAFGAVGGLVTALQEATAAGARFVFGYLAGGDLPFEPTNPNAVFILAFQGLPIVLVLSALVSLLTYWRILPWIVRGFSAVLERTLGIGGALGLGVASNVFVGMIEAPLFIRPYMRKLTRSELFVLMTTGMATIAGTMFALYALILTPVLPEAAGHLLAASVISAPAAVTIALLMMPETEETTSGRFVPHPEAGGSMDAIVKGTMEGVQLLVGIAATLIVLVALVALANQILALLPAFHGAPLSLERMFGWVLAPLAFIMGVPWSEAADAGSLLGTKLVLNELVAYVRLAGLEDGVLSERTRLILVYAMCGFANFGSLGIMVGGMSAMVPERRAEIAKLGPRTLVSGMLATCATGAVIGILTPP